MEQIPEILKNLFEPAAVLLGLVLLLLLNAWIFKRLKSVEKESDITKNSISFFLILLGMLVFVLSLPIENTLKGQIITFLSIIISAGIALSSTTLLGNLIAGIMNNSMKRFRNGDLIRIGEMHGRVTKKSLLHTEIQLEDSNFITIPNLYIANHPVKLTRKSNTVISTGVSLGYDVSRNRIEQALKEAATDTGLSDPYVYIMELGDFSVVYRVHGFLEDSSKYFSTSSLLNAKVMDKLHEHRIEIVSPTFMNQRRVDEKEFIPSREPEKTKEKAEYAPEELVFDEAVKSQEIEKKKDLLKELGNKQEELKEKLKEVKDTQEKERIKSVIERNEELREQIEKNIEEQIEKNKKDGK